MRAHIVSRSLTEALRTEYLRWLANSFFQAKSWNVSSAGKNETGVGASRLDQIASDLRKI